MAPQRAMQGPAVAPEGSLVPGATNAEALGGIVLQLGGPPVIGDLYRLGIFGRVGTMMGSETTKVSLIAEFLGLAVDEMLDESGRIAVSEPAMLFAIRNPVLPHEISCGTRENPLVVWPFDIWHLRPAQPGDLKMRMPYKIVGEGALGVFDDDL